MFGRFGRFGRGLCGVSVKKVLYKEIGRVSEENRWLCCGNRFGGGLESGMRVICYVLRG